MKEFADDNFKFDENGRKLSKWVENTVGKGEIARYEQFLLFPQCFQKACFPGASKGVIVWEWVKKIVFLKSPLSWRGRALSELPSYGYAEKISNKRLVSIHVSFWHMYQKHLFNEHDLNISVDEKKHISLSSFQKKPSYT